MALGSKTWVWVGWKWKLFPHSTYSGMLDFKDVCRTMTAIALIIAIAMPACDVHSCTISFDFWAPQYRFKPSFTAAKNPRIRILCWNCVACHHVWQCCQLCWSNLKLNGSSWCIIMWLGNFLGGNRNENEQCWQQNWVLLSVNKNNCNRNPILANLNWVSYTLAQLSFRRTECTTLKRYFLSFNNRMPL